jgi:hypothetical protein
MKISSKVIDASGNLILSKNDSAIYISDLTNTVVKNFTICGCTDLRGKWLSTKAALWFIWSH